MEIVRAGKIGRAIFVLSILGSVMVVSGNERHSFDLFFPVFVDATPGVLNGAPPSRF